MNTNFIHNSTAADDISPLVDRSKNTTGANDSTAQMIQGLDGEIRNSSPNQENETQEGTNSHNQILQVNSYIK
jgi:hypothetical protein